MNTIKSKIKSFLSSMWVKGFLFMLVGYLLSILVTPAQTGKTIHSGMTKGCNVIFQNNICNAVGLRQNTLSVVYKQEVKAYKAYSKKTEVKKIPPPTRVVRKQEPPVKLKEETFKVSKPVPTPTPRQQVRQVERTQVVKARVSSTPVSLDVR